MFAAISEVVVGYLGQAKSEIKVCDICKATTVTHTKQICRNLLRKETYKAADHAIFSYKLLWMSAAHFITVVKRRHQKKRYNELTMQFATG